MEFAAALLVAALCIAAGSIGLLLIKDAQERAILIRLFLAAFALRLAFTIICYQTGVINLLGGADDIGWRGAWALSRHWEISGPDPLLSIYDPATIKANPGWRYFSALFYYVLDVRSQMALAVFNGFLNSLTVIVIYKIAREFFSEKASVIAAGAAVIMPGFLIWSALTIKETWLILFEISVLFALLRLSRERNLIAIAFYALLAIILTLWALSFRFYIAWFMVGGAIIAAVCFRAQRPIRAATLSFLGVALFYIILNGLGIVRFDLTSVAQAQIAELTVFRDNISDAGQLGTGSAVRLGYDTTTPAGAASMMVVGSFYLLLSPFPWQLVGSVRQMMAMPDVLLWWVLVFGFIIPGARYAWKNQPAILISVFAFAMPLILFYGMMFGNVGLAFRQRAQIMPFLLVLVAAGYDSRHRQEERKREDKKKILLARLLRLRLQSSGTISPSAYTTAQLINNRSMR